MTRRPQRDDEPRARGSARRGGTSGTDARTVEENVEVIRVWEEAALHQRSRVEQLSDRITQIAGGTPVLVLHVIWFTFWLVANLRLIPDVKPFDPFPFQLLTTIVSLEAIFLTLFVLASQNRLTRQSDKRAHLDLQINLLAEWESTVALRILQDVASHLKVKLSVTPEQLRDLESRTDIDRLTQRLDDLPEAGKYPGK
jgi:uncharacterized membrane protein